MIRYLYLVLLLCLNQSFAQDNLGVVKNNEQICIAKSSSIYCDVNYIRQHHNLCVAASTEMVLDYYGKRIDQKDIKRYVDKINYKDNDRRLYTFVYFDELIKTLKDYGFNWETKTFSMMKFDDGLNFIINELKNNRPVIVATSLYGEHTVVVNGYSEKNKTIIITDPNLQEPGIRILTFNEFKKIWTSRGRWRPLIKT